MREVTKYECEVCGRLFDNSQDAVACEDRDREGDGGEAQVLAFDLFKEVHTALKHPEWATRGRFYGHSPRKAAWRMIARIFLNKDFFVSQNSENLAYDLFVNTHRELDDGVDCSMKAFDSVPQRKDAWFKIAEAFERRANA